MGARRRSSKSQGIRKKGANKQTLLKVADRRERKKEKIEASIVARDGIRQKHLFGAASFGKPSHPADSDEALLRHVEQEDEKESLLTRKIENLQSVYSNLVDRLNKQSNESDVAPISGTKNLDTQGKHLNQSSKIGHRQKSNMSILNQKKTVQPRLSIASTKPKSELLVKENREAALRDAKHFGSDVAPKDLQKKPSVLGVFPGLGKVSACVATEQAKVISELISKTLGDVDDTWMGMQPSLFAEWRKLLTRDFGNSLDDVHKAFIALSRDYKDVFMCGKYSRKDETLLRRLYVAHCFAHVLRCRNRVVRNDGIAKRVGHSGEVMKDQGYSRARILILLPMKNLVYDVVIFLQALAAASREDTRSVFQVANKERFENEFGSADIEEDEKDLEKSKDEFHSATGVRSRKPEDYRWTFRGNIDDDFKLGIALSKNSMKLYSDFYMSDIIIASPLGLRRSLAEKASGQYLKSRTETKEDNEKEEWQSDIMGGGKKRKVNEANSDFLSSIEICAVDGLNVFSMQNWDTLNDCISMLNNMPSSTRATDFSRVRDWCLDGFMRQFRQTILLSEYRKSEFMSLYRNLSNHSGKVLLLQSPEEHGTMANVVVNMKQTFFKLPDVESAVQLPDSRFKFFFEKVLPELRSLTSSRSLIVIPTYFDYVRVRNKLLSLAKDDSSLKFSSMSEYSKGSDISRARSKLFDGTVSMVLMTERFHFFWRHWIRGARVVVWYSLPENALFYPEILNMLAGAAESNQEVQAIALYSKYDYFCLERIVGVSRGKKMNSAHCRSIHRFRVKDNNIPV